MGNGGNGGNTDSTPTAGDGAGWDFFVSYTQTDLPWAEWIAWALEEAGFRVLVQAWDFTPGSNWVSGMHDGVQRAARTIAVLSDDYTRSVYGTAEWQAAWTVDPSGAARKLLMIRVADCPRPGLLGQIVPVDLFALPERRARAELLRAATLAVSGGRAKPDAAPPFPGARRAVPVRPPFPGERPEIWNVPPRLAHFVGRDDLLDQVHEQLATRGTVAVCALHGLGGIGKTALAIEYAHRHPDSYDLVWWIPAEDPELIGGHVSTLGMELGLPDGAGWPAVRDVLRRENLRWLVLLDNIDDRNAVGPFRPTDHLGRLLVTSRRTGLDAIGTQIAVPELPRHDAIHLLTHRIPDLAPATAGQIAELLGDLPLAVEQAAGYLTQTGTPPEDYTQLLHRRLEDMLHRGWVADRPGITIADLWALTLTRLRTDQPAAVHLLELCALCAPEAIPLDLISDNTDQLPAGPLRDATADPLAWADTVGALVGYGLARRNGPTLTVHRLIAATVRRRMPSATQEDLASTLVRLLRAALPPYIDGQPEGWPRWRSLLPHGRAVLDAHDDQIWDEETRLSVSWLCDRTANYLSHHGRPDAAIPYLRRGITLFGAGVKSDNPISLTLHNNLATAYWVAGSIDQAITLYEQTLADSSRILGPDHPNTLTTRNNLAQAYESAGNLDQAITLHQQNLTDSLRVLGPDHPDALTSRNNLAYTHRLAGHLHQAITLHTKNLTDRQRILGTDHPDTLTTRNNLAQAYESAGNLDQAITLYEKNLTDRQRVLGPDHPDTLTSYDNLAGIYESAGRLNQAIHLYEQTLTNRLRVLGPDHPDTLTSRNNLAYGYQEAGQIDQAITLHEKNLTDRQRVLGPDHPHVLQSRNNLASAYYLMGNYDQAIVLYKDAFADSLRILGSDHPETQNFRNNLATSYGSAGRLDQAITLFEQTLADQLRILGPDHPKALTTRNNLAQAYESAGNLNQAIALHEQNFADQLRILGPDHPEALATRNNLASAYFLIGQHDRAITLYEKALTDSLRTLGAQHPITIAIQNNYVATMDNNR